MQLADTDDLALWYALNRLMTNYWADSSGSAPPRSVPCRQLGWHEWFCRVQSPGFVSLVLTSRCP
jgi:hypothetical protein